MTRKNPWFWLALGAGSAALWAAADQPARVPCCFTNPGFSGVCTVEPGPRESCSSILAYLNDPQSQGKNYCSNTGIRGGWKPVACEKAKD